MLKIVSLTLLLCAALASCALAEEKTALAPAAGAKKSAKKVLVFNRADGFKHQSIPTSAEVFKELDTKSDEFDFVITDDIQHFEKDKLNAYDAVIFCLTTGEFPFTDEQKAALLEYVASGRGGLAGIHSATDTFYKWPEFGAMLGGYFDGHPWNATDTVTIKNEQPKNPIVQPWGAEPFELVDEIYQIKDPYDRKKQDVLLSLDTDKTDMTKPGIKRTDKDFAVAWTKTHGKGRVFYTSLGHNDAVWRDPRYQAHVMEGLKWVTGVDKASEDPKAK